MEVFVGRQPILDDRQVTRAYELLFRDGHNGAAPREMTAATPKLISRVFFSMGVENVLGTLPGFLNVDRETLLDGVCHLLPPQRVVLELLETVEPDEKVVAACERLREAGFVLALDDFLATPEWRPLLPMVSVIKVDFRAMQPDELSRVRSEWSMPHVRFLAEKVETREEFDYARELGFSLFQGYFFAKPVVLSKREMPSHKLHGLQILAEAQQAEMRFEKLAQMIRTEISLSRRLLRFINCPLFDWLTPVTSIERALSNLGEEGVRRWLSVAIMPQLASGHTDQLWVMALARARFCEIVAQESSHGPRQNDMFLMGLFSLLDTMLGMPMEEATENLGLVDDVREFLCRKASRGSLPSRVWSLLESCEAVDAGALERAAGTLRLKPDAVAKLWADALSFSSETAREMRHESIGVDAGGISLFATPPAPVLQKR